MDIQAEVTKRIQAELGNLIVQLTMKGIECEVLQKENAELRQQLATLFPVSDARPVSGHGPFTAPDKGENNGN